MCYHTHWKEHKAEHNRLVKLLPSTGERKEELFFGISHRHLHLLESSNGHQIRDSKKHQKEVFFNDAWHPWFVGWNMRIMADEIASGNEGLAIYNKVFHRDLAVSEGFDGRWNELFEQLREEQHGQLAKELILLIARRIEFLTSAKDIAEIMKSHYDSKNTFALF